MNSHSQEVCGLSWSPSGQYLASGANDNKVHIWHSGQVNRMDNVQSVKTLSEHTAAVKVGNIE